MKKQSVTSSILWLTIAEIFFNFSGYVIHSVLGRMLGPSDYGRYGLIINLTTTVVMLIGNGIPIAMSKYVSSFFETRPGMVKLIKKQSAALQAILMGAVTAFFYLLAPVFSALLHDQSLTPLFRLSAFILPAFAAASFYLYYFIGIHRFNLQALLKIIRSFARIIFVILLAFYFGVSGSVMGYVAAPAFVFLVAWVIDRFWIKLPADEKRHTFDWKQLLHYAWPVTLFMLFFQILTSLDLYMVKSILQNDRLTGIYNAALTLGYIPYYLFYALTMVMLPSISRTTAQEDHAETTRIISQSFRMMVMLIFPLAISLIVYARPVIQFFFGNRYLDAILPFQILAFGISFLSIFYVMSFALNGAGKIKLPMYISLIGMTLNAFLNYFFILRWGLVGSATATALTAIAMTLVILFYIHKHFRGLMSFGRFANFLLAGSVALAASSLMPPEKWIFVLWSLLLTAVYVAVLTLLGEFGKNDIRIFLKIITRKK